MLIYCRLRFQCCWGWCMLLSGLGRGGGGRIEVVAVVVGRGGVVVLHDILGLENVACYCYRRGKDQATMIYNCLKSTSSFQETC